MRALPGGLLRSRLQLPAKLFEALVGRTRRHV
jgi:hypothetical protein